MVVVVVASLVVPRFWKAHDHVRVGFLRAFV